MPEDQCGNTKVLGTGATVQSRRYILPRITLVVFWAALWLGILLTVRYLQKSNLPGRVVDEYMPVLWFGTFIPPFAAVGALIGRHGVRLLIGGLLAAISWLIVLFLNNSGWGN